MTTSSANPNVEAIRLSVQHSYDELQQLIDGPLAQLDPAKLYQAPAENEWSIMQNLAHIVEFMPYWANEVEKLVAHPGQNFGRTHQHEDRLRAIEEHSRDSLEQIKALLPGSYARLQEVLSHLTDSDLELTGMHIRFGEKPLDWFIEDFITGHLIAHLEQMRADMAAVG
ncbi:MAG TPA: DinB family protein [Ktedonobacteraceae bacterium]|nr:DinB family protein [Ktedonobacteraceae bacterium]